MRKFITRVALIMLCAVLFSSHAEAQQFTGSIVLGRPTDRSITVSVLSSNDLQIYLEYGLSSGVYSNQTAVTNLAANQPLEVELNSLQTNTCYYYRLQYKSAGDPAYLADTEHTFHTQRAPGSTFTFSMHGDTHPERAGSMFNASLYTNTLAHAAADKPDFYMLIGDDFSVDQIATNLINQALVTERYTLHRPWLGLVGNSAPLFLVNGNHEQGAQYLLDGTSNNIAVWAQNARNKYFPEPAPDGFYTGNTNAVEYIGLLRNYFAWTWGDALFVTIDPYWGSPTCPDNNYWTNEKRTNMWDVTLGDVQYQWLKKTLEESTAQFKFVFAHHVNGTGRGGAGLASLYEWGGRNANGTWGFTTNRPGWELPIHQLMATNRVTMFVQGHDHIFVREQLDGVTYLTLPIPADNNYALYNADAFTNAIYKTNNTGYVRFTVAPEQVKVDYVRTFMPADEGPGKTNGMVDYSFTLPTTADSNSAPVILSVTNTPAAPTSNETVWVTASVTDDVAVAQVTLTYNTGAGASQTNTVFLETMASITNKPWTGSFCDKAWTVSFSGSNPFEQRGSANYGSGNTNGLSFKNGTTNLMDSMITTTGSIDAQGGSGFVEFWMQTLTLSNQSENAGWTFQLNAGTGYVTRLSELISTNHTWKLYHYDLQSNELVSNLTMRFQFRGGDTNNRVYLDQISLKVASGGSSATNVAMLDDGAHQDGAAGDGIYGASIPAMPTATTVNYYLTALDGAGLSSVSPAGAPGNFYSYTVTNSAGSPDPFSYDIMLGRPTDHSIAVSVLSSCDLTAYVEYGSQPSGYTGRSATNSIAAGIPFVVTLDQLQADSPYYYRLCYQLPGETNFTAGAERTFHTQRAPGSPFTFIIEADPHYQDNQPPVWQLALTNMLIDKPDFLIDLGDTFMGEKYYRTNSYTLSQAGIYETCKIVRQQFFGVAGHSAPLFLVIGNHDPELGWLLDNANPTNNPAVWGDQARKLYYPSPIPGEFYSGSTNADVYLSGGVRDGYYSFEWGDALFVALDPYWYTCPGTAKSTNQWAWTLGTNQYQWLKRTLETSPAKFKFVFAHNLVGGGVKMEARGGLTYAPYFEWGGKNLDGSWGFTNNRPGWAMPIQDLLLSNGVNAFFHGHDHLFVKEDLDINGDGVAELIYQECPQPSFTNYNSTGAATGYGYTNGVLQ
ncbi:MAG: metallophosphoesterase, partial [Kiritimatiellales bacterium]